MELFSEVYGCYYEVVAAVLRAAPLDRRQIEALVSQRGYGESTLQLIPKLLDEGAWPLLTARDGRYDSRLRTSPTLPLTLLEASWLKALLADARIRLFLSDDSFQHLSKELADVEPLYRQEDFLCFDRYLDGDPYADEDYRRRFQAILAAMRERAALSIAYTPPKGRPNNGQYIPLQLEYSAKDDKFRVFAAKVRHGQAARVFQPEPEPHHADRTVSGAVCRPFGCGSLAAEPAVRRAATNSGHGRAQRNRTVYGGILLL